MFFRFLSIYKDHLSANKKAIIVSSIGLLFALGLLASSFIYVDSTRNLIFSKSVEELSFTDEDISYSFFDYDGRNLDVESIQLTINSSVANILDSSGLRNRVDRVYQKSSITGLNTPIKANISEYNSVNNTYEWVTKDINKSVTIVELNEDLKSEIQLLLLEGSEFPTKINESLLLFVNNPKNLWQQMYFPKLNENKSLYKYDFSGVTQSNETDPYMNYSVSGIAEIDIKHLSSGDQIGLGFNIGSQKSGFDRSRELTYPNLFDLSRNSFVDIYYFVTNLTEFSSLLGDVFTYSNEVDFSIQYSLSGFLTFDYSTFDSYSLEQDLKTIFRFTTLVQDDINKKVGSGYNSFFFMEFRNIFVLDQAIGKVNAVIFNLLLYFIPILFVTLYLANYSFGLISRALSKRIAIYKLRGLQNIQLLGILLLDSLLSLLIGVIGALFMGQLIAFLILKTSYILEFNNPENISLIFRPDNIFVSLLIIGLVLSFLINSRRIYNFIRKEEITFKITNTKTPIWRKSYLDIVMIIFGYLGIFIYTESIKLSSNSPIQQFNPFVLIGLISTFSAIIGLILFLVRLYTFVLGRITNFSWNTFGGLFALALKNVSNRFQSNTIKTIVILALITATSITFLTLPYSTVEWKKNNLAYEIGADGRGTLPSSPQNQLFNWSIINDLETNYSNYFESISPYFKLSLRSNSYNPADSGFILAINTSTYLKTAKIPVQLETRNLDLNSLLNSIKTNNSDKLLLHKNNLDYRKTSIGNNVTISGLDGEGKTKTLNYKILDSFSFWPTLYYKVQYGGGSVIYEDFANKKLVQNSELIPKNPPTGIPDDVSFYGIVSIDKFVQPNFTLKNMPLNKFENGYYFNFKDGANISAIKKVLEGKYDFNMRYLDEEIADFVTDISFMVGIGQINANIIINLLIAFTLLLMFSIIIVLERKKSMLTEKTLGMRLSQTYRLLFYESSIVILSGLFIGNILGGLLSQMMSMFVTLGSATIDYVLLFPIETISNLEIIFLVLAGAQILVTIILVSRTRVSTTLLGDD